MNYIQYQIATGAILNIFDDDAVITEGSIKDSSGTYSGFHWDINALGKGTVPDGAENISEVSDFEEVDIPDEVADRAFEVKALKTLAILCNKRFTGAVSGAITKAEFLAEYKK